MGRILDLEKIGGEEKAEEERKDRKKLRRIILIEKSLIVRYEQRTGEKAPYRKIVEVVRHLVQISKRFHIENNDAIVNYLDNLSGVMWKIKSLPKLLRQHYTKLLNSTIYSEYIPGSQGYGGMRPNLGGLAKVV